MTKYKGKEKYCIKQNNLIQIIMILFNIILKNV